MSDTNIVILKGRLTRAAETRVLPNGTPCTTLALAVGESRKNQTTGEWENHPHFFDVASFSKYAQNAICSLTKGREVLVSGRLRQERWQKDGQSFSRVSVVADNLEILREPKGNTGNIPNYNTDTAQGSQGDLPDDDPFRGGNG